MPGGRVRWKKLPTKFVESMAGRVRMTHEVILTARAVRELDAATDWIARYSPQAAERWLAGFLTKIVSLKLNPLRTGPAREQRRMPVDLRQLLYGRRRSYRAIFIIRQSKVVVLSIRHTA